MKKTIHFVLVLSFMWAIQPYSIYSQINFDEFTEQFNSDSKPEGWESDPSQPVKNWEFHNGSIDNSHPPFNAYEGNYNAVFLRANSQETKTKLVTPPISFEFAIKPVLLFYHSQIRYEDEYGSGNTRLNIHYRSPEINNNNWVLLKTFEDTVGTDLLTPEDQWVLQEILLPDSVRYSSVQIGFEGWSSSIFEHGTCIDDISIIETGIIPKYINSVSAIQASNDIVPTGSNNNPILRLKFAVKGNDGELFLDSLTVNGLFDSPEAVAENGVKLFSTTDDQFNDTIPISSGVSFENGKATFSNIQFDLPIGNSYVWITYDIPVDTEHNLKGKVLDASIDAYGIKINNDYYPSTEIDPTGTRYINESLFFDDFEGDSHWILGGEFQIDEPKGKGGTSPEPDPTYAQSGKKVMGTDLTGLGIYHGDYEKNISFENRYIAQADTTINAKYYKDLQLGFYRWLNLYVKDTTTIEISLDGGSSWNTIWMNTSAHIERNWDFKQINLANIADRATELKFRYTLGPTDISPYSGWNIDNVGLTGTFVDDDAGLLSLISPSAGCGHYAPEPLEIEIQNYGYSPTNDTIPVGYSIDNGETWIMDTIFEEIPRDGTTNFTFNQLIDLTTPGAYHILVQTFYPGDEDFRNDQMDTTLYILPDYSLPYSQNFEQGNDFWTSGGENKTWALGKPTDTTITNAYSGNYCWVTNLNGHYPNNDSAWIESPCFDFSNIDKPIFECKIWADAEENNDGMALYYSLNEGNSWNFVPTETTHAFDWNWYNNATVSSLGTAGFDTVDGGWFLTRQLLPDLLAGESTVKFRILFTSNESISDAGIAIDDIQIYDAPTDAGVTAIINPGLTPCELSDEQSITLTIENFGIRGINPNDAINTSVDINGETALIETFYPTDTILVGESENFTFTGTADMLNKQDYNIVAYTNIPIDTSYYISNDYNDTLITTVVIKGAPEYTLGPDIGTMKPDTVVLNALQSYPTGDFDGYLWKNHFNDSIGNELTFPGRSFFGTGVTEMEYSVIVDITGTTCTATDTIKIINSISDLGITAASGTSTTCINDQESQSLNFSIENFSAQREYTNEYIQVGYQFDGGEEYVESFWVDGTLSSDTSMSFITPPVFPDSGNYTLKVFSVTYADLDYTNDTSEIALRIHPLPDVDLGDDTVYTMQAITTIGTLDVTDPYFNTYKWQDDSSNPTFDIPTNETGLYSVEVTDIEGCGSDKDSLLVVADNWVMDTLISPVSNCELTNSETLSFVVINNSPNTYLAGHKIMTEITINEKTKIDSFELVAALGPSDSIDYVSAGVFDFSEPNEYAIYAKLTPDKDIDKTDNALNKTINIWGAFKVNLGYDTIYTERADTVLLDAGAGYSSYLWTTTDSDDNDIVLGFDRFLNIPKRNSTTYKVAVTSEYGCSNSTDSVTIIAHNIGISEILDPASACELTNADRIRITLQNYGPDELPAGESIKFFYQINNGVWNEINHTTSVDILSGESQNLILFEDIPFESTEAYDMKMYVRWDKDYFPENDTAFTNIYQYPAEHVDLGPDIITNNTDTVIIDAGPGSTTYTWHDGSENQTFNNVNPYSDSYHVTVTNAFGCYDSDTILVYSTDLNITYIAGAETSCLPDTRDVKIEVKIAGQDTLFADSKIEAWYQLNNGDTIKEIITLTDTLHTDTLVNFTFSEQLTITDTGNYKLTTFINPSIDAEITNNIDSAFFRVGPTVVDLGDDITTYNNSITLDAGTDFDTYLWDDDTELQTRTVNINGTYSITTTDTNGCNSSDTIDVLFLKPSYEITEITGLSDSCQRFSNAQITYTLQNTGNDTIFSDSTINIAYTINNGAFINENYTFSSKFAPGNMVSISFDSLANLSSSNAYKTTVYTIIGTDSISIDSTINTWGLPDVDLGDDIKSVNDSVKLDAGTGFSSYLWNTSETTQIIYVTAQGNYSVTVTSEHGCNNSDAINVSFVPYALRIIEFVEPVSGCFPLTNKAPRIRVENYGNRTIPTNTIITLGYKVNNQTRIDEDIPLVNEMGPNLVLPYTFNTPLNIEQDGIANIQFYAHVEDLDVDTANYTIEVFGLPVFAFDADTLKTLTYPYTIDPDVDAESYLWNTGETTPTISVDKNGHYSLQITDINTCQYTDSVFVLQIFDPGVNQVWSNQVKIYPNPASETLNIELPEASQSAIIEITDAQGKLITHEKDVEADIEFNIENWSQGVYFIRVFDKNNYAVFQVIVQ